MQFTFSFKEFSFSSLRCSRNISRWSLSCSLANSPRVYWRTLLWRLDMPRVLPPWLGTLVKPCLLVKQYTVTQLKCTFLVLSRFSLFRMEEAERERNDTVKTQGSDFQMKGRIRNCHLNLYLIVSDRETQAMSLSQSQQISLSFLSIFLQLGCRRLLSPINSCSLNKRLGKLPGVYESVAEFDFSFPLTPDVLVLWLSNKLYHTTIRKDTHDKPSYFGSYFYIEGTWHKICVY